MKQKDSFRNNFYDSRIIIYMPSVIKRMKNFVNSMKKKKLPESKELMKNMTKKRTEKLINPHSLMLSFDRLSRKSSIFTIMTQKSKLNDLGDAIKRS